MKGLAISNKGMEDITAEEIKVMLNTEVEIKEGCVVFEFHKLEDLGLLCYEAHSVNRLLLLLDQFKLQKIEDLERIKKINLDKFMGKTFAVRAKIIDNKIKTKEIEKNTGDKIEGKVQLDKPETLFFVYLNNQDFYFGIDIGGDLSKRDYKLMTARHDIKGPIAYAILKIGGYNPKKKLVDPFCMNGTITIEAEHWDKELHHEIKMPLFVKYKLQNKQGKEKEIYGLDSQLKNIKASQMNAKVGNAKISFAKLEVEWLDTKFKKEEIDYIISNGIRVTERTKKLAEKLYKELFYQASYVLKKNGLITIATNDTIIIKEKATKEHFNLINEKEIIYGEEKIKIASFKKE